MRPVLIVGGAPRVRIDAVRFVQASASGATAVALRRRVDAALVVANSLCGTVQALVDRERMERFPDRDALLAALADRLTRL